MSARTVTRAARLGSLALGLLLASRAAMATEYQIRPFAGATFGGGTALVNLDQAAGSKVSLAIGVTAARLGEVLGIDVDFADVPGFFQGDRLLVLSSRVTTLTGNIIVAAPRRFTEYWLRPYVVGGAGLMRIRMDDVFSVFPVTEVRPGIDVGAGVLGFVTNRVGVAWELRRFQTMGGKTPDSGLTFGGERLSFWRATMALAIRY